MDSLETARIPLFDAVFLPNGELLAAGMELQSTKNLSDPSTTPGIVLRSVDRGKTWNSLYRSKHDEMFVSLTAFPTQGVVYAVSDRGSFVKFNLH